MFQEILDQLVARTGARAAAFCDYEGEAVVISPRGTGEYETKVAGATMCAALLNLTERWTEVGVARWVVVRTAATAFLMAPLKDGYYVLLLCAPGQEGRARHHMADAASQILADM